MAHVTSEATHTTITDPRQALEAGLQYEKSGLLDRALEHYRRAATITREGAVASEAWRRQASVHRTRCEWDKALDAARAAADVAKRIDHGNLLAEAINAEALVHQSQGRFDEARRLLTQALERCSGERVRGIALQNLGSIAAETGDLETAEQRFLESSECFQRAGYRWGIAFALNNSGRAALERGELGRAESTLEQAVLAAQEVGDLDLSALATMNFAEALAAHGNVARAEELASISLGYFTIEGNTWRRVECLRVVGDIAQRRGQREAALRCYQQGLRLAGEIGARHEVDLLRGRLAKLADASRSS
ncbi:MAG: tetratricopeptide repeat protein [Gemmatimonadaceae bacterium]